MKKTVKEWTVDSVWGKIAMVSWGNPTKPPILLVHGYMDSVATFTLLVDQLPDSYYYVGFDMPGHGKSDPFPNGPLVSQLHIVETVRLVVDHMKWDQFVYLSHSMGFIIGVFYNHLFPGKITKMVHVDPAVPTTMYYYVHKKPSLWFSHSYDSYYSSYERWNAGSSKKMTLDEAVNVLVMNRSISEEQAEMLISRSLIPVGEGKYKFSWDSKMKKIVSVPLSEETFFTVITQYAPPTLIFQATENSSAPPGKQFAIDLLEKCRLMVANFFSVTITGGHDIHITNTESIVPHVVEFLKSNVVVVRSDKSKL